MIDELKIERTLTKELGDFLVSRYGSNMGKITHSQLTEIKKTFAITILTGMGLFLDILQEHQNDDDFTVESFLEKITHAVEVWSRAEISLVPIKSGPNPNKN